MKKIGLIAGSIQTESYAKKISQNLGMLLPSDFLPEIIKIDDLPLFSDHLSLDDVEKCEAFRRSVSSVDGLCLVTPEINHGMPGCLKNAIDIASVSDNGSCWSGKPTLTLSVSTGPMGGLGASRDLKQVALTVGMEILQPSEIYLGTVQKMLNQNDILQGNTMTMDFLRLAITNLTKAVGGLDASRFAIQLNEKQLIFLDGEVTVGFCDFALQNGMLTILKIQVEPAYRGRGIASQIMARCLVFGSLFGLKIIPQCSYAQTFFEKHPSARKMLAQ
ncbi:GNAT family N-acetyltransferase [Levilactobacillus namurensis]|uniref:GNAT family N-acetyltransferase n=1 Tax=Levilactobacillus namurensis TaxID=380393 RepID=UPI0026F12EF9|nr:GNAT family N-acetyltransferase [Levilactobacillus namurensis]